MAGGTTSHPRSTLYVPASRPRMLEKLVGLGASAVILDLEDGVAPGEKEAARGHLRQARDAGSLDGLTWTLRINAAGSPWFDADLLLAEELAPENLLLPKAESLETVEPVARSCGTWGGRLSLMIETAVGLGCVRELAAMQPSPLWLVLGSADLRRALGAPPGDGREWERHALAELLLAARMCGCQAIDSVYFRFRDEAGLRRHGQVARDLGYDGKSCIHPAQLPVIHELFASTEAEIRWSHRVLAAWDAQDGESRGVVVSDGEMIEALHLQVARRILDRRP